MIVRTWVRVAAVWVGLALLAVVPSGGLASPETTVSVIRTGEHLGPFGLNGSKAFHFENPDSPVVAGRLELMRELGVQWERTDLWWHSVERSPGKYDWSRPDRVFDLFEAAGVQWYPVLDYGAAWWKDRTAPANAAEIGEFAEFVYQTVSRYRGRAPWWSLWNKPNDSDFWTPQPNAEMYAALLKASAAAARQADPEVQLCAPVTAPMAGLDRGFIERLYQLGALEDFDVFDYHYYRNSPPESEVPAELAEVRALMARYGHEKPIWISEMGVSSGSPPDVLGMEGTEGLPGGGGNLGVRKISYDQQAALVVRNHLLCLALGVERIFYFDLQNWFDDQPEVWDSTLGLVDAAGRRKPSFDAYRTLVRETNGKEFLGRCVSLGNGVEGVLIRDRDSGEYTLAAWHAGGTAASVEFEAVDAGRGISIIAKDGSEVTSTPALGIEKAATTRSVKLDLDHHPRYIHGVEGDVYLPDATIQLLPAHTILAPGEEYPLQVRAVSGLLEAPAITVQGTTVPAGIIWDPAGGTVALDGEASPGKHEVAAVVAVTHGAADARRTVILERRACVEVVPDLTIAIRPHRDGRVITTSSEHLVPLKTLYVDTTLTNHSFLELSGTLTLVEYGAEQGTEQGTGEVIMTESAVQVLKPFEVRRVQLGIPLARVRAYTGVTTLTAEFGPYRSRPFHIAPVAFSGKEKTPVVDGDLSDWPDSIPALRLNQARQVVYNSADEYDPSDISGEVRLWFTDSELYVAARVVDDQQTWNPNPPRRMDRGDSLALHLGLLGPARLGGGEYNDYEYHLGLAPMTAGGLPAAFGFHEGLVLEQTRIETRETADGYLLEARIPLGELASPLPILEPGGFVGLDLSLHDGDTDDWAPVGKRRGRSLNWNRPPAEGSDSSATWGLGVLVPVEGD